ncbi:F-box protein-like protein isoform X1 [Tanacetum coccineum]
METIATGLQELSLDNEELPLSIHKVMSSDDMLNEILLRLPVISLVLFKSVSKRWLSLIKSPTFSKRRSRAPKIDPPSGLFIERDSKHSLYGFVPLDIRIPSRLENTFKTEYGSNSSNVTVLQSCNGLFLCSVKSVWLLILPNHPTTKSCMLRPLLVTFLLNPIGYKLTLLNGNWSIVCSHSDPFEGLGSGIYCNDAIHWINCDDNGALHYKLDFVNKSVVLTKIQLPVTVVKRRCKLFESRGCLLLLGMDKTHSHDQLNVYEMGNGDSEWLLKYSVNH